MSRISLIWILIILGLILLAACGTQEGGREPETQAMVGFIEISDNILHITPVEVIMLIDPDFPPNLTISAALGIIHNDPEAMEMTGLTYDDFPNGFHIRPNWHADLGWHYVEAAEIETLSFEIADNAEFIFRGETTNRFIFRAGDADILDEILPHLYPTIVHFIEVYDGRVLRLVQEFIFTQ
jgi:hypothetical protein